MSSLLHCSCGQEWESNVNDEQPTRVNTGVSCPRCHPVGAATLSLSPEAHVPTAAPRLDQTLDAPSWPVPANAGSSIGEPVKPTMPTGPVPRHHNRSFPQIPGYEILGELGRGGMGVVYKARQIGLNRLVALKMILASQHAGTQQIQRFRAEAEAVARMHHPNIVQIYEVGEQDGHPFFSLEFVAGGTLADRLEKERLPFRDAAELMENLARAMHYAHEHGIVHRDLKPANILLEDNDSPIAPSRSGTAESEIRRMRGPKIADFGLAKNLESEQQNTQSGAILGTPSYMSPEQACGDLQEIGPPTDIYALGTILYELLTGKPPFSGGSSMEIIQKVMREEPTPPRRLQPWTPRDLEIICLKCLHKSPKRRYATAGDLADDLRHFLDHEPIRARPVSIGERAIRWARQHPAWTGLGAGLLVAMSVLVLFEVRRAQNIRQLSESRRAEARALLDNTAAAVKEKRYEQAREILDHLQPRLTDDLPRSLHTEATELNREVDGLLNAVKTYRLFLERRDVALFYAGSGNFKAAAEASRAAMALVNPTEQNEWNRGEFFSDDQANDITRGCLELLLVTAEAEARPLPGETPELGARRGLAVLERAPALALEMRAFHLHEPIFSSKREIQAPLRKALEPTTVKPKQVSTASSLGKNYWHVTRLQRHY